MTEQEYIVATNLAKIRVALTIMRDVMPGHEYKIDEGKYRNIVRNMMEIEELLNEGFELEIDDEDKQQ